jgi:hypothetical protein
VRVGQQRQALRQAGRETRATALEQPLDRLHEHPRLPHEVRARAQDLLRLGQPQQHERLVIEKRALIQRGAVRGAPGAEQPIRAAVVSEQELEAAADQRHRVARPAQSGRVGERVHLSYLHARAARIPRHGSIAREALVESAAHRVIPGARPQRVSRADQPVMQLPVQLPRGAGVGLAHLEGSDALSAQGGLRSRAARPAARGRRQIQRR